MKMKRIPLLAVTAFAATLAPGAPLGAVQIGGVDVGFSLGMGKWSDETKPEGLARTFLDAGTVRASEMATLSVATNGPVVTAVWQGHPVCGETFAVTADFTLRPGGGFEWTRFSYSGNGCDLSVKSIAFPEIVVPRTDSTALFVPTRVGEIYRPDWNKFAPGDKVFSRGPRKLYFRCMAALGEDGEASHFLDQRGDARRWTTALQVLSGDARTLVMRNVCYIPVAEATRHAFSLPYPGVYAPYNGGWFEAASMHRDWLKNEPHFKAAAKRDFSKLRDIALWMWSRGGIDVSEPPVHWFMKETGLKVGLDWYWWHAIPYDTTYPFFWPPRDGEEAFCASVKRMKTDGAFVQVYTNGMLWDCDDSRWEDGGLDSTLVKADGRILSRRFNPYTKKRQAWMCGEAPKFQRLMKNLESRLAATGLDGVYMDMISCNGNMECYNPRHAHAPGGGTAGPDGFRAYVGEIRQANPGFVLSSEEPSEEYYDLFDAKIVLYSSWERSNLGVLPEHEPVPASTLIYRGAVVHFGSFATPGGIPAWDPTWGENPDDADVESIVARYPDQFAVEFARGVIWGIQPMVHNLTMKDVGNPRLAEDMKFIKDPARFYFDNRDFLFDGEMLKPATLACAARRVEFLSASCYTRPKEAKSHVQEALPCVFHSEWEAKDGRKAAFLVNWTRENQEYALEFCGQRLSGTLAPRTWKICSLN